jgi:flagellar biosynthesis protein FliP
MLRMAIQVFTYKTVVFNLCKDLYCHAKQWPATQVLCGLLLLISILLVQNIGNTFPAMSSCIQLKKNRTDYCRMGGTMPLINYMV